MKKLAFFALSLIATAAMAAGPVSPGSITIHHGAVSEQTATITGGIVKNTSQGNNDALQNVASNSGKIDVKGKSYQTATFEKSDVTNLAKDYGDFANQNISSNAGKVLIDSSGKSTQVTTLKDADVSNKASGGGADALQNLSSNNGKITVSGTSEQTTSVKNSSVSNEARGHNALATQNLSSNFGNVLIAGKSTQMTSVSSHAAVMNLAKGANSHAAQNIASNDACNEPRDPCPSCHGY
jgi:hypothetical protein